jgi:flavin-dependent dehydrogenase
MADRQEFPRDKVCGDALIPDSLAALDRLGLKDAVNASGWSGNTLHILAPNGTQVKLNGEFVCLPRRSLDSILQEAAVAAGATFLPQCLAVAPIVAGEGVGGARFRQVTDHSELTVRAHVTLLATGASAGPLSDFGVCLRTSPSALAVRAYYRVPDHLGKEIDYLSISYERSIRPGYGWIFPGPDNLLNLGIGIFCDADRRSTSKNPHQLWSIFTDTCALARRILKEGEQVGRLRGAPLRTGLTGARLHRKGLLVLGEAAGLTYSFSGEGIGKAMESGILAGEILAQHFLSAAGNPAEVGPLYENALRARHGDRFRAYKIAQDWLSWPSICNLIARRANSDRRLRELLEGMLTEKADPRAVFSVTGFMNTLFR